MALELVATPSALDANTYATLEEANAYFEGRLNASAWSTASDATKAQALVMATSRLDQEKYLGERSLQAQRLKWPREYVENEDGTDYLDADVIPKEIREATCELALALVVNPALLEDTGLEGLSSVSLGPLSVTPNNSGFRGGQLPRQVSRLLAGLSRSGGGTFHIRRG